MLEPSPRCARNCPPSGASSMVSGPQRAGACLLPWQSWVGQQETQAWTGGHLPQLALFPTATTASRFYRIDRAQVRTQGLLRKPLAPGPVSPVLLGRPARACSPMSADGQCTGTVLTAGSWARGVGLWGSLKAQASSSQTQKERRFGSEAGHPVKA